MATAVSTITESPLVQQLERLIQASRNSQKVRVSLLTTHDRNYALTMIKRAARAADHPLFHFSMTTRRRLDADSNEWEPVSTRASDAFGLLQAAAELNHGAAVILDDCLPFLKDEGGDARMRFQLAELLAPETIRDGLVIIFLEGPSAERHLPEMLREHFVRVSIPYPRREELAQIGLEEISSANHRLELPSEPRAIRETAILLSEGLVGLTRSGARDALRDALFTNPGEVTAVYDELQAKKSVQLKRELAMNVWSTAQTPMPVGLDYMVEYIRTNVADIRQSGAGRAKGVLLVGPPGTGKTMVAKAIGTLIGLPVVEFRVSSLMSSLLGETEQRFARAFATLEAMAPNVVFIDEIEKAFGDSSERDGGTMMRCTGALLSWLSDNPNPNFIVATANNIRRMGEIGLTMTRSGRFDACFFVDVPNHHCRRGMLEAWLRDEVDNAAAVAGRLANATEKFSGADLHTLLKRAKAKAKYLKRPLTQELLIVEAERLAFRVHAFYDEFEELRRWGRIYCEPAGPIED